MGVFAKTNIKAGNRVAKNKKPDFLPLEVKDLKLAPYQRGLRQSRVKAYADRYNPNIFGVILVSFRDGQYWIVDGQHRVEVAKLLGINTVWCQVLSGLTYEEEAEHFYEINDSKSRLNANHKFHSKVEAKDRTALDIVRALNKYGFTYSKEGTEVGSDNCIKAVSSLQKIYNKQGYNGLCTVLDILRRAWNGDKTSLKAEIIKGLNTFVVNYEYDRDFLVKVLERHTPKSISDKARAFVENVYHPSEGGCFHIAQTIRNLYDNVAVRTKGKQSVCAVKISE